MGKTKQTVAKTNEPKVEGGFEIGTPKELIEEIINLTGAQIALLYAENEKLRLQVKVLSVHLSAYEKSDDMVNGMRGAFEYIENGFAELYGIGVRDGKLVYLDSGAELPRATRSGEGEAKPAETQEKHPPMKAVETEDADGIESVDSMTSGYAQVDSDDVEPHYEVVDESEDTQEEPKPSNDNN